MTHHKSIPRSLFDESESIFAKSKSVPTLPKCHETVSNFIRPLTHKTPFPNPYLAGISQKKIQIIEKDFQFSTSHHSLFGSNVLAQKKKKTTEPKIYVLSDPSHPNRSITRNESKECEPPETRKSFPHNKTTPQIKILSHSQSCNSTFPQKPHLLNASNGQANRNSLDQSKRDNKCTPQLHDNHFAQKRTHSQQKNTGPLLISELLSQLKIAESEDQRGNRNPLCDDDLLLDQVSLILHFLCY